MGVTTVCSACDVVAASIAAVTPIPGPSPIKGEGG